MGKKTARKDFAECEGPMILAIPGRDAALFIGRAQATYGRLMPYSHRERGIFLEK